MVVLCGIVAREWLISARLDVIAAVFLDQANGENSSFSFFENGLIHIGRIDATTSAKSFLTQQNCQRVHFLAGGATGMPDSQEGTWANEWNHVAAHYSIEVRITEHRRHIDRGGD